MAHKSFHCLDKSRLNFHYTKYSSTIFLVIFDSMVFFLFRLLFFRRSRFFFFFNEECLQTKEKFRWSCAASIIRALNVAQETKEKRWKQKIFSFLDVTFLHRYQVVEWLRIPGIRFSQQDAWQDKCAHYSEKMRK